MKIIALIALGTLISEPSLVAQRYGPSSVVTTPSSVMVTPSSVMTTGSRTVNTTPRFNSTHTPVRYQRPMNQAPRGQRSYDSGYYYYQPYQYQRRSQYRANLDNQNTRNGYGSFNNPVRPNTRSNYRYKYYRGGNRAGTSRRHKPRRVNRRSGGLRY